jgi:predicted negative regulator of RcsB-dependent stress response
VSAKKISRKELLKEPDEFITTSASVAQYMRENTRQVIILIGTLVVALVIGVLIYGYRQNRLTESHMLYQKAYLEYSKADVSAEKVTDEQWRQILQQFDQVIRDYGATPDGELALLYSGHTLYKLKDFKGAAKRYEKMQSTSLVKKGLGSLVMYHLAMTRLASKDYEEAVSLFDQLCKITGSPYSRAAHASIAKIYMTMGKDKEALQAYRQYLKMFPQAPDAPLVRAKIALLSNRV